MNKQEFLAALQNRISGLPRRDMEEQLNFYAEMIDDRMEEGIPEEEAVSALGSVEAVAAQIVAETPLARLAKEKIKPQRRLRVWEIVLLAVGSPIWFSLLIAAVAVVFSLYVVLWSLAVSFWSVFAAVAATAPGAVVLGVSNAVGGNGAAALAMIAAAPVCAGLAIFLFHGCKTATGGCVWLTKKSVVWIKRCFLKGGEAR